MRLKNLPHYAPCSLPPPHCVQALRQVNSSWAWLVNSGQLCRVRRLHGLTEPWVYLRSKDSQHRNTWRAFDLTTRTWHSLPPPPFPSPQVAAEDAQALELCSRQAGEASEAGEDSQRCAAGAAASAPAASQVSYESQSDCNSSCLCSCRSHLAPLPTYSLDVSP